MTSGGFHHLPDVIKERRLQVSSPDEGTFEADPETERMLLESIVQCDRGEGIALETVLADLRRNYRQSARQQSDR